MNKFYVLVRDDAFQIIAVPEDNDPLYGYGSWNKYSGPFDTWDEAEDSLPELDTD